MAETNPHLAQILGQGRCQWNSYSSTRILQATMVDTRMDFDLGLYLIREQRYMGLENHKLRAINSNDFLPVHVLHLT